MAASFLDTLEISFDPPYAANKQISMSTDHPEIFVKNADPDSSRSGVGPEILHLYQALWGY